MKREKSISTVDHMSSQNLRVFFKGQGSMDKVFSLQMWGPECKFLEAL